MRNTLLSFLLFILITTAFGTQASAEVDTHTHQRYHGVMSDYYYDQLARCETGRNWNHSTKSYTGGFGIARGTWRAFSNSASATDKPPEYQVAIADNIAFYGHKENGRFQNPVGPWGWGCVKHSKLLSSLICKSRNPLVKPYKRRC